MQSTQEYTVERHGRRMKFEISYGQYFNNKFRVVFKKSCCSGYKLCAMYRITVNIASNSKCNLLTLR